MGRIGCPATSVTAINQRFVTSQKSKDLALRRKPEINILLLLLLLLVALRPNQALASSFLMLLDHTQRHTTVRRTPLDERLGRRDLYLTTHITHKRQKFMPPAGFEPTTSAGERPQTHALDSMATVQLRLPILFSYCKRLLNIFQATARTLLFKLIKRLTM